jgi:hypothetical protein
MIMDVVLYRADNSGPIIAAEEKFRNCRFTVEHPDVRFWHKADIPTGLSDVRFWE